MTFDEYQKQALTTAIYADNELLNLSHWALGLTGESGEIAEKVKKIIRDNREITDEVKRDFTKEMGDVLWYLAVLADHLGVPFEEVAKLNVEKLKSRKERGVIGGSGDNR